MVAAKATPSRSAQKHSDSLLLAIPRPNSLQRHPLIVATQPKHEGEDTCD